MMACPHCHHPLTVAEHARMICPICGGALPIRFDPYHEWLGISPRERPITLYRLLGLAPFEQDEAAISNAADRQLVFLRQVRTGPRGAAAEDLIRQVSEARNTLLDPHARSEYNAGVRAAWAAEIEPPQPPPPPMLRSDPIRPVVRPSFVRRRNYRRPSSSFNFQIVGWVLGGLVGIALAWAILWHVFKIDAVPKVVKDFGQRLQRELVGP
jgi:hypothetical protein